MPNFNQGVGLPKDESYQEWLRFIVQSLDHESPDLNFLVKMWCLSIEKGTLEDHEEALVRPYLDLAYEYTYKIFEADEESFEKFLMEQKISKFSNVVMFEGKINE